MMHEDSAKTPLLLSGAWSCVLGDASGLLRWSRGSWWSPWLLVKLVDSLLRGMAQVCFANNPWSGALILVGLFLADVYVGLAACACSVVAIATAKGLGQSDEAVSAGLASYSAVLVGSVTVALHPVFVGGPVGVTTWLFMLAAAAYSVVVGVGLHAVLKLVNLPLFTLPFNIVTTLLFLALTAAGADDTDNSKQFLLDSSLSLNASGVEPAAPAPGITWRQVVAGSLVAVGQVYAVEHVMCSVLILIALAINSSILCLACYGGGLVGTLSALLVTDASQHSAIAAGVWGYNAVLGAGCAAFFLEPSWRSLVLGAFSATSCTLLQAALQPVFSALRLPVLTVPFCAWSALLLLVVSDGPGVRVARVQCLAYPEQHLAWARRRRLLPPAAPPHANTRL
ncbi:urea transporter 2 [Hyalella azteca]|uniref:Urea transporter 2 n=1 Tax=Hyalella azteca TaxID=294128 RepID=A0A8B7NH76_HYAAZ|nr:urea transporter 2 [Hyalella azteca]